MRDKMGTQPWENQTDMPAEVDATKEGAELQGQSVLTLWSSSGCGGRQVAWAMMMNPTLVLPNPSYPFTPNAANSMRLFRMEAGTIIDLFADSGGSSRKAWARVTLKLYVGDRCVPSFEMPLNEGDLRLEYHGRPKELNGKVAHVKAYKPGHA